MMNKSHRHEMDCADAKEAFAWWKRAMRMQDWDVQLFIQDDPPEWVGDTGELIIGQAKAWGAWKIAKVWVSVARSQEHGPLHTLFHELLHVQEYDVGLPQPTTGAVEFFWSQLAFQLRNAYQAARR